MNSQNQSVDYSESVLDEAQRLVTGGRGEAYGHPLDDYTRTAAFWTILLADKLLPGAQITAQDAIRCMIAVKLSRDVNAPKRDNRTDIAGYALCLQMADDERARRKCKPA